MSAYNPISRIPFQGSKSSEDKMRKCASYSQGLTLVVSWWTLQFHPLRLQLPSAVIPPLGFQRPCGRPLGVFVRRTLFPEHPTGFSYQSWSRDAYLNTSGLVCPQQYHLRICYFPLSREEFLDERYRELCSGTIDAYLFAAGISAALSAVLPDSFCTSGSMEPFEACWDAFC